MYSASYKMPSQETLMQDFVKQMLVGRLFIGTFREKRYVDAVKDYRDVIVISEEEEELIRDMEVVRKRVENYFSSSHWIGITTPEMIGAPAKFCVWAKLPEEVFGSYWYKISKVKFSTNETLLRLKVIRPINNPRSFNKSIKQEGSPNTSSTDFSTQLKTDLNASLSTTGQQLRELITIQNTGEVVRFTLLLIASLATAMLKGIEFLGNFTVRLVNETSNFITSATPIILACINLIAKIIGGFYLLILSMWRDRNGPRQVYNYRQYRPIGYRNGVHISEINS